MNTTPTIDDAVQVPIDVEKLITTKMLIVGNSGAGKGWGIRRLAEQTFGRAQHIILDPEGEFHTLRERFDYILIGRGGEAATTVKSAPLLARRLLELGVSAIIDLSDLPVTKEADQRALFVQAFLADGLMQSPRDLWHDLIVVLDEAQIFAPEKGVREAPSTSAVIDYATRGRKRGFCLVAATQRLSELHKSVAAECNNRLIGRTALDVDQDRAAKALGMRTGRETAETLRNLDDGEFFAWGPALTRKVVRARLGSTVTAYGKASTGAPVTPPRARVREVLGQLADLEHEAEAEAREVEALRKRVRELQAAVENAGIGAAPTARLLNLERELADAREHEKLQERIIETLVADLRGIADTAASLSGHASGCSNKALDMLEAAVDAEERKPTPLTDDAIRAMRKSMDPISNMVGHMAKLPEDPPGPRSGAQQMQPVERAFLTTLAQRARPLTKREILALSDYSRGGTSSAAFTSLARRGWTQEVGERLQISPLGLDALGPFPPMKTGRARRDEIRSSLTGAALAFFNELERRWPSTVGKGELLKATGYARGGTSSAALTYLVKKQYAINSSRAGIAAHPELFNGD